MSSGDNIELLRDLRRQSIAAAYIGDCLANAPGGRKARLSIGFATADDAIYTGRSQGPLRFSLASTVDYPAGRALRAVQDSARRRRHARRAIVIRNLLCVPGAFAFGLTPTGVVLISNFGTSTTYNGARRPLREAAAIQFDTTVR